jgi:hypothetical protein
MNRSLISEIAHLNFAKLKGCRITPGGEVGRAIRSYEIGKTLAEA